MSLFLHSVEDKEISAVIDSMFESAGMADKQMLTLEDFNRILRDHKDKLDQANLNFAGNFYLIVYILVRRHSVSF